MMRVERARPWVARLTAVLTLLLAISVVAAGAGRTRPGGSGGGSRPHQASGHASYGHSGGHGHSGHHGGYGHYGYYGGHHGYHLGYYGWLGWPWGWSYGGWPVTVIREQLDADAPGAVETDVTPKKADLFVDGQFLGQARDYNGRWDLLWLEPGRHVFEFRREGYMSLERELELRAGMLVRIEEQLQKGEGSDPRSTRLPEPPAPAPAAASAAESDTPGPPSFRASGLLHLAVEPVDAAVYLDGEYLARGSELARLHGALPVARGVHVVEVVRPGYDSRRIEVDVVGADPVRLEIRLERGN